MNAINKKNSLAKKIMVIGILGLLFIATPIGLAGVLVYFDFAYAFPAILATISFVASALLIIRQKRINVFSIAMLIVGLLFLASSVVEFGFGAFTQNMSIHDQIEFSGIIRPNQVSHGLASIGVGVVSILVNFRKFKSKDILKENELVQKYEALGVFLFGLGVFFLLFGVYVFINGLQPL